MKCPDCDRERVETMEEFWKNPIYSCPVDVPRTECNDSAQGKVSRLEAALAERGRRIAELETERVTLLDYTKSQAQRVKELEGRRREMRQLLHRMVKYCREDRATTARATRLERLVSQVADYLNRTHDPKDILRTDELPQRPQDGGGEG